MRTIVIRPFEPARDTEAAAALDASFETEWVFAVMSGPLSFALVERPVRPALEKRYEVPASELRGAAHAVVA